MEQKLDLRVQRTYKMLTDALLTLLQEKKFEQITVGELCERAMVRRATFYKHFGDKYELYTFVVRELVEKFTAESDVVYDGQRPRTFYVGMIDLSFKFVEDHREMMVSMAKSGCADKLFELFASEVERDMRTQLQKDEASGVVLLAKPDIIAAAATGALVYIIKWWIAQDFKTPREELVSTCLSLVRVM